MTEPFGTPADDLRPALTMTRTEYEAALAQARADGMRAAVQVRPLVWHEGKGFKYANAPWGQYTVSHDKNEGWLIDLEGDEADVSYPDWEDSDAYGFATEADAMQAIGENYIQRIKPFLAALAPAPAVPADAGPEDQMYLICKHGGYYRPNAQGYTSDPAQAGRYTLEEAISHSHPNGPNGPRDGMTYIPAPPALRARQTPAPVGEPVAWIVHDPDDGDYLTESVSAAKHSGHAITTLYANPTPAPQVPPEVLRQVVDRVGMARLLTDTGFSHMGETVDYSHKVIEAIIRDLDAAIAAVQPYVEGV